MKVIVETDNKTFLEKYKEFLPQGAEVKEMYEIEIKWYQKEWYTLRWWQFVMWICERIVPELKHEPNNIRFGLKKHGLKTKQTK